MPASPFLLLKKNHQ